MLRGFLRSKVPPEKKAVDEEKRPEIRQLSEEEKQKTMASEEFRKFFDRTSRIIERALTEKVNRRFKKTSREIAKIRFF